MDNQQERSAFELGWLIGIIDGEGSFWMSKGISSNGQYQYYQPVFEIVNTNFEIISKIRCLFHQYSIPYYIGDGKRNSFSKPFKRIEVKGVKRLYYFFSKLMPYFECRKAQASLLNEFVQSRVHKSARDKYTERECVIYQELKDLNHRGS